LKAKGLMDQNDYITYSKTDWNPLTSENYYDNANMTKTSAVSYDLYFSNRTKINLTICSNTTTDIKIPLANINDLNTTAIDYLSEKGVNAFDPNATYFTDRCIPLTTSDKEAVIGERRAEFQNLTLLCNGDCQYGGIDSSTGYVNCLCNAAEPEIEVGPVFEQKLVGWLLNTNIEISKCFNTVFSYVSCFNK